MLTTLLHSGVGDVAAVVTRYYGGTKLGTGGLVRAYGGTLRRALDDLPLGEHVEYARLLVILGYPSVAGVQQLLPAYEGELLAQEFLVDVALTVRLPVGRMEAFQAAVQDATRGRALITPADDDEPGGPPAPDRPVAGA
jgi:putative IMPACT (imprinted ancient) family translation regulator